MSTSTDRTTWAPTGPTVTWMSLAALVMVGQLYATIPLIDDLGRDLGVGPGAAAWVSTVFGFAYAAGMLVAGPLSDLVGRRRVALTGLVAGAATTVAVAVVPGFVPLLAARAMQGLAIALYAPVALAYLGERIDPRRRSVALTTVIGSFLAAAVLAPLASQQLASWGDRHTWFWVTAPLVLGFAVVMSRVLLADEHAAARPRPGDLLAPLAVLPRLLADRRLLALYAATLTVMLAFVGATTAVQLGGPGGVAGDPTAMQAVRAWTLPACVLVPLASPLLARAPSSLRAPAALALIAVGTGALALVEGRVLLVVAIGVVTAAVAAAAPALVESIGRLGADHRGAATALYGFCLFVGASLGPVVATATHDAGFVPGVLVLAALAGAGAVTAATASR